MREDEAESVEQQPAPQRPPSEQNQMAKLTTPQLAPPKPSFNTPAVSPGKAIEQAARAALANPGGYGGDMSTPTEPLKYKAITPIA